MQKKYRLTEKRSFDYMYRKGQSVANKQLVLLYAPTKKGIRIGFVVSKKVGKSVVRNKTKRRLREIVRPIIPLLDAGYNYVFIARSVASDCDYSTLEKSVHHLLKLKGLIHDAQPEQN